MSAFKLDCALKWQDVKSLLLQDLEHRPLVFYLEKLMTDLREESQGLVSWLESRLALESDLSALWLDDAEQFASADAREFKLVMLHFVLAQVTDREKLLLRIPRLTSELAKVSIRAACSCVRRS